MCLVKLLAQGLTSGGSGATVSRTDAIQETGKGAVPLGSKENRRVRDGVPNKREKRK